MNNHFLSLLDLKAEELEEMFVLSDWLRETSSHQPFQGKTAALIFQKPSLRTRVSFEVGIYQLGGHPIFLSQESIGIGVRESAADVARLLSRYCMMVVARLYDHQLLLDLARHSTIPVINALTDYSHPCQVMADLYTIRQQRKLHPNLKVVFIGDGNNVVNSWLEMAMLYPLHFVLACPPGYEPDRALLKRAQSTGLSRIEVMNDVQAAVRDADVLYTDVWASMGQEQEAERRRKDFAGYAVTKELLQRAKTDCIVLHCLPAHRGEEITEEVLDGPRSVVFDQAENRLHVQKAIMLRLMNKSNGTHLAKELEQKIRTAQTVS
ncbi:MAG TPA: ornithine carbamoyltransferase [Bacteroidota bacterium]|nr:ornithine carbamoyltransferase [Bacteroidota bacterium]